jgi:hypothetical protein
LLCNDRYIGGYVRPVTGKRLGKHVPAATATHTTGETGCCLRGPRRGVIKRRELGHPVSSVLQRRLRRDGAIIQLSLESQSVKTRLGDWCEMAASLGVVSSELTVGKSSTRAAVKIGPEHVKLKNLHC